MQFGTAHIGNNIPAGGLQGEVKEHVQLRFGVQKSPVF